MSETWRAVVGWEGLYEVSDLGRVRSVARIVKRSDGQTRPVRARVLAPATSGKYPTVTLTLGAKQRSLTKRVHKLVADAFLGLCPEGQEVLHGNGDHFDARRTNLRYGTHAENGTDMRDHGRTRFSPTCGRGHRKDGANRTPRGKCRACERMGARRTYARQIGVAFYPDAVADRYYREIMGEVV